MSEQISKHQFFQYDEKNPFHFVEVMGDAKDGEGGGMLLNHWHEELEFSYGVKGHGCHYINGELVISQSCRMVSTNSNFIHNIIPDPDFSDKCEVVAVVIIIHPKFITDNFPEYREIYFTNEKEQASTEIQHVMVKIRAYIAQEKHGQYDYLYAKSLILELLYHMCQEGIAKRVDVDDINVLRNIERMKGVLQFVENHYAEHIAQTMIAKKFYFSSSYFAKYFKKCTGMTFIEYLTNFRLGKARLDLLHTDKSVLQIAMENGFSDDRRLIIAFKKKYGTTPLQYRKQYEKSYYHTKN